MDQQEYPEQFDRNYFPEQMVDPDGMRYRLEGSDVIETYTDFLKGGVKAVSPSGEKTYYTENCLMNELGIARVRLFISTGVNKINHLTKYANEERIMRQLKAMARSFIFELALNTKRWAPEATFVNGVLINPTFAKVRNKRLVQQCVENALLQSMNRGNDGFEAMLTGKSWGVTEVVDNRQQQKPPGSGFLGMFRGGRGGNMGGGNYYG